MTSPFKQRLLMSGLGILIIAVLIYFSYVPFFKPIFLLANIVLISFALLEYYHLAQNKGATPLIGLGIACAAFYLTAVYLSARYSFLSFLPSLTLLVSLFLVFMPFFNRRPAPLMSLATTAFGFVYLALPLSCMIKLNYFFPPDAPQDGRLWLAYCIALTKATDIGAYLFGKTIGRHKLAPHISPQKTIEGAIGGACFALITSLLFYSLIPLILPISLNITMGQSIIFGLVFACVAQFGDLAESILKRDAEVKDSSRLPGLGGILDVVDSLVFTAPLMYIILKMEIIG